MANIFVHQRIKEKLFEIFTKVLDKIIANKISGAVFLSLFETGKCLLRGKSYVLQLSRKCVRELYAYYRFVAICHFYFIMLLFVDANSVPICNVLSLNILRIGSRNLVLFVNEISICRNVAPEFIIIKLFQEKSRRVLSNNIVQIFEIIRIFALITGVNPRFYFLLLHKYISSSLLFSHLKSIKRDRVRYEFALHNGCCYMMHHLKFVVQDIWFYHFNDVIIYGALVFRLHLWSFRL